MDDQSGGAGWGQGGHGPEPVPVVVRPRPVLEVLDEEATRADGVSDAVVQRILAAGFSPEVLEPFLVDLVPRCSRGGLFGVATLCLELVGQTGKYRAAAEAAVTARQFEDYEIVSLTIYARNITEESSVIWWHDVFVRFIRDDAGYEWLLATHGDLLLAHRYEAVLDYLLRTDRGPRGYNVDSMVEVLQRTDRPGPFVTRWVEWIKSGRFDGHGRPGDESASILAICLNDVVTRRPEVVTPLVDEAIRRWRWQLNSPDEAECRRGVDNLLQVLHREPVFAARVQVEVLHAVATSHFAGWESFDRAFTALRHLQMVGEDLGRHAFTAAFDTAFEVVHPPRTVDGLRSCSG